MELIGTPSIHARSPALPLSRIRAFRCHHRSASAAALDQLSLKRHGPCLCFPAGGGFSWWKSPLKNRITRYRQYNLPIDSPGFYVYLKGADGVAWSPTWRPVETPLDAWQVEHRPGLTRFIARKRTVQATLDLFIAPGETTVVWDLKLDNLGDQAIALDVTGYVEFCLLDWKQYTDWACYVKHNLQTAFDKEANAVTYLYRHFHFNPQLADCPLVYFGASESTASFDGDRDAFMGNYRDERNPIAVELGACRTRKCCAATPAARSSAGSRCQPAARNACSFSSAASAIPSQSASAPSSAAPIPASAGAATPASNSPPCTPPCACSAAAPMLGLPEDPRWADVAAHLPAYSLADATPVPTAGSVNPPNASRCGKAWTCLKATAIKPPRRDLSVLQRQSF